MAMTHPTYPHYKPSGVEWLGDVPRHWEVKRLKNVFINLDRRRIPISGEDRANLEKIYPYYGASGIIDYVDSYLFDEDLILVAEDGANLLSRSSPLAFLACGKYWVNNHAHILKPKEGPLSFWEAILQTYDFTPLVTGAAQPKLTSENLNSIFVSLPPLTEQHAIAEYLDRETGRIDTLMTKKRALIERLKEKRTALISRTVTRGLPPDAARAAGLPDNPPLKSSGVEWLGDVPVHWEVKRLKHIFPPLQSGVSVNSENNPADEDSLGILKTSCVYNNEFQPQENKKVLDEEIPRVQCPVTRNSIIISRMNTPELVGNCGYVDKNYLNLYLPDRLWIANFSKSQNANGKFFWYLISSQPIQNLTAILATGTSGSMKNLTQEAFLDITTFIPPLAEQNAIAAYLDAETRKIDMLVAKIEAAIERLQEYRSALITAAVTGKIDVRGPM